ncbi:MAG TPA: response regulator [Pyrinomonadaceae bacterium]|nr:response regulator [Pyrinomonadaceae bacterium]
MIEAPEKEDTLKRVLFVDDEQNVLDGLQRMLRPLRRQWDMSFALDGPTALQLLSERPFDVIVTDMRMPGMDGAQLLSEIKRLYPRTARIILSGHSDHEMIMKSVSAAHQFLSKPCEPDVIKEIVGRACALRELLTNPKLELLISEMRSLPSLPSLYVELMEELDTVDPSIKQVANIVSRDPGMTAKILQLVNSAFFGLRRRITSASDAVSLLGLDMTRTLVLSIQIFSEFDSARSHGFPIEEVWSHSMGVASLAQAIAKKQTQNAELAQEAFTAGLLHEIGRLILAAKLGEQYKDVLAAAEREQISITDAERKFLGAAHPEVGAYLLGLWGLPDSIVQAVAFHHHPGVNASEKFDVVTAVHIADCLKSVGVQPDGTALDLSYLEKLGVTAQIPVWEQMAEE